MLGASGATSSGELLDTRYRPVGDERPPMWLDEIRQELELAQTPRAPYPSASHAAAVAIWGLLADPLWAGIEKPHVTASEADGVIVEFALHPFQIIFEADAAGGVEVYLFDAYHHQHEYEGPLRTVPGGIEKWAWCLRHAR